MGYVENRNVAIEYRYADGQRERLAAFAAELARHQVAVIYAIPTAAAVAAKGATSTIPIVFAIGDDPVATGLVASFNRPGGNVTGFTGMSLGLLGKQLGMLREAVPKAGRIAVLVNPANPVPTSTVADAKEAAAVIRLPIEVLTATTKGLSINKSVNWASPSGEANGFGAARSYSSTRHGKRGGRGSPHPSERPRSSLPSDISFRPTPRAL